MIMVQLQATPKGVNVKQFYIIIIIIIVIVIIPTINNLINPSRTEFLQVKYKKFSSLPRRKYITSLLQRSQVNAV
jgi:short subunit fatty acids transporter